MKALSTDIPCTHLSCQDSLGLSNPDWCSRPPKYSSLDSNRSIEERMWQKRRWDRMRISSKGIYAGGRAYVTIGIAPMPMEQMSFHCEQSYADTSNWCLRYRFWIPECGFVPLFILSLRANNYFAFTCTYKHKLFNLLLAVSLLLCMNEFCRFPPSKIRTCPSDQITFLWKLVTWSCIRPKMNKCCISIGEW